MRLRNLRKVTQEGLAEALGVSRTTIMNWETGRATPRLTVSQVKTLCRKLRITLDELPDNFGPQAGQENTSLLRQLREQAGLTEVDLARELSIGERTVGIEDICAWEETGEQPNLSISQLVALCDALDVTARQLADYLEATQLGEKNESQNS